VRELRHAVQRAVALSSEELTLELLLPQAHSNSLAQMVSETLLRDRNRLKAGEGPAWLLTAASATYEDVMRQLMEASLERHGSIRRAAAALGLPKSTFADRARKLGIPTRPPPKTG
jgi:transcriptional regulator with GAF, ATPase, and Fis domain